jgi:hypothetical protein
MALQSFSLLEIPDLPSAGNGAPSFNSYLIDAANEKLAFILYAPKSGSIRKVGFRTATVTTGIAIDVRIETVDATTGDPTGTLWGTNTNVSHTIADADDNVFLVTAALTADAVVTKGDLIAVVLAGPGAGSFAINFAELTDDSVSSGPVFPYTDHFTGTWAKATTGGGQIFALEYSDGTYAPIPNVWPIGQVQTDTFNSGSATDERALKFKFPFPVRVTGFWAWLDLDGDCDVVLYDSDGTTALLTKSLDKDIRVGTVGRTMTGFFSGTVNIAANTFYRLAIKPTSGTSLSSYRLQTNTAALMDAMSGGANFHGSSRVDAGAWTDATTDRPLFGLYVDCCDDGNSVRPQIMKVGGAGAFPVY